MTIQFDETVRWSWSYWAMYIVPSAVLWVAAFRGRAFAPGYVGFRPIVVACLLYCFLHFYHCCRLHETQTDPTDDVWFLFAPVGIMIRTPFVCGASLIAAAVVRDVLTLLRRVFTNGGSEVRQGDPAGT